MMPDEVQNSVYYEMVRSLYSRPQLSGLATHRRRADFLYRSNETGAPLLYHWIDAHTRPVCLTPGDTPVNGYAALHPHYPWAALAQDEGGSENYWICRLDLHSRGLTRITPEPLGRISQILWLTDDSWIVVGGDMQANWVKRLSANGDNATLYATDRWIFHTAYDSPGSRLFVETGRGPNQTNIDIAVLDIGRGEPVRWLSESEDSEEINASVLAGRLAYSTNVNRATEQVVVRALDDWREVARVPVTGEISTLAWLDDTHLLATYSHQAVSRPRILRVGPQAGEPAVWSAPIGQGSTWGASVTAGGPVWAASALDQPPALYRAAGEHVETLLAPSAGEGYVAGESVTYPSFDGQPVQGWLLRSPRADAPLVVYVHGGPTSVTMDMWRVDIQALAQAGYHVFAPNYRGSSTFGTDFRLANIGDLGGGDAQDVLYGARFAAGLLGVETLPAITGRSYGGYLTLFALTTQPDEWVGGVAVVPVADWVEDYKLLDAGFRFYDYYFFGGTPDEKPELYRDRSPITHLDRLRAPTLILHGENDSRCPIEPVIHFATEAQRRGLPVEMIITPAEGHGNQQTASAIRDTVLTLEHLARLW